MQQTAVEWLVEQLINEDRKLNPNSFTIQIYFEASKNIIEQAKDMEKEQSMNDFMAGKWDWAEHIKGKESKDPAEYYNETYKTQA